MLPAPVLPAPECGSLAADLDSALARLRAARQSARATDAVLTLAEERDLAARYAVPLRVVEQRALAAGLVPLRYQRNLGTVGAAGQARLLASTVAVAGCGGLGGWVIEGLARMGVGRLTLMDADCFDESNLNRQLGSLESTLGQPKAHVLAERVRAVNAAVTVTPHVGRLTTDNATHFLEGAEAVVDALDTIPDRLTLARAAASAGLPLVHGAVAGYTGQVMTILPGDPGLEALYGGDAPPERGLETTLGNPAATPMMVAAWQIQEVVKILVGSGELIRRRLLILDAECGQVAEIRLG